MNTPQIYFDHEKLVACQRRIQFKIAALFSANISLLPRLILLRNFSCAGA
jgi:hypothetical protein